MALYITFKQLKRYTLLIISLLSFWIVSGHFVYTKADRIDNKVIISCYFLLPMNISKAMDSFNITSETPNKKINYSYQWKSPYHLTITIDENNYPRGVKYTYQFKKSSTFIPLLTVSKAGHILTKVSPKLVSVNPVENAPTLGPIILNFSTPIDEKSINKMISCEVKGKFIPFDKDYSRWKFIPVQQLRHQQNYHIIVKPGLKSRYGLSSSTKQQVTITTAPPLKLVDSYPKNGSSSIWLSRTIKLTFNQPLARAKVKGNCRGKTIIKENTVLFKPDRVLSPSSHYRLQVEIQSIYGEKTRTALNFSTTNLGNKKWIEIKSGSPCQVWLMQGKKQLQKVDGWFTRNLNLLPKVTMYETDRGRGTGVKGTKEKLPWIRLNTDILLHPTTYTGKDDHDMLGLPHTYSCILLPADVLEELYNTYPKGLMVIVH
ncbi:MAG: Ig-like domain-containing protein [Desulfotomaculum sp.]|nr:Ig-like domain-containing protein [Desulfotomaculum sp.]